MAIVVFDAGTNADGVSGPGLAMKEITPSFVTWARRCAMGIYDLESLPTVVSYVDDGCGDMACEWIAPSFDIGEDPGISDEDAEYLEWLEDTVSTQGGMVFPDGEIPAVLRQLYWPDPFKPFFRHDVSNYKLKTETNTLELSTALSRENINDCLVGFAATHAETGNRLSSDDMKIGRLMKRVGLASL